MYDKETKLFPDLNPTVTEEPQTYRLNRLNEIETLMKWKLVNKLPKK